MASRSPMVAAGEIEHALEIVTPAIERIEQFDSSLNAVIHRRFDEARRGVRRGRC